MPLVVAHALLHGEGAGGSALKIDGETMGTVTDFILFIYFFVPKSLQMVTAAMKLNLSCSLEEKYIKKHIKKQRHYFANKSPSSQSYGFSSYHVWM